MRLKVVLTTMMLGVLFSSIACSSGEASKYTRADCIVEVDLVWNIEGVEKVKLLNFLADSIDGAESLGYKGPFLAGFTFQKNDTKLYIQYYSECEERLTNTEKLMGSVSTPALSGKVHYQISESRIKADVKTIMLEGAAWVD